MAQHNPNPGQPVNTQTNRSVGVFVSTPLHRTYDPNTNLINSGSNIRNDKYIVAGNHSQRTDVRNVGIGGENDRFINTITSYTDGVPSGVINRNTQRYPAYRQLTTNFLMNPASGENIHTFTVFQGNSHSRLKYTYPVQHNPQVSIVVGSSDYITSWMSQTILYQSGAQPYGNSPSGGWAPSLLLNAQDSSFVEKRWVGSNSTFNMNYIFCNGFGFNIPSGAVINGCEFRVNAFYEGDDSSNQPIIQMNGVRLSQNFDQNGTNTNNTTAFSNIASGDAQPTSYNTYGSATHKGNLTLTPSIVNGSGFGYSFRINKNSNSGNQTGYLRINHAQMRVYYTA